MSFFENGVMPIAGKDHGCPCPVCTGQHEGNPLGWLVLVPRDDAELVGSHVIPHEDIAAHSINDEARCACGPNVDEEADGLVIHHNAFDRREEYATGQRKPS